LQKGILTVLCELFYLNELEWTDDFDAAVKAAGVYLWFCLMYW